MGITCSDCPNTARSAKGSSRQNGCSVSLKSERAIQTSVVFWRCDFLGCRVCFTEKSGNIVLLVAGGDKRTQSADIRRARLILKNLKL